MNRHPLQGLNRRQFLEFLPNRNRPLWLPGEDKARMPADANMAAFLAKYPEDGVACYHRSCRS